MKFSIIIPVYNVAPYLRECLGSIAAAIEQCKGESVKCKVEDVEVICVDDGSTDGSAAILDEYAERNSYVKVIHQSNQGVSVARNVAIENATGDWIFCLDGDDLMRPDFLAKMSRRLEEVDDEGIDVVITQCEFEDGMRGEGLPRECDVLEVAELMSIRKPYYMTCTELITDKLFRREMLNRNNIRFIPKIRVSEDNVFARMALASSRKVLMATDIDSAWFRARVGSVIHTMSADKYLDNLRTFKRFVAFAKERKQVKLLGKVLADQAFALMFMARRDPAARGECIETLIHDPAFNRTAMWMVLRFCRFPKPRLFALAYLLCPITALRRMMMKVV